MVHTKRMYFKGVVIISLSKLSKIIIIFVVSYNLKPELILPFEENKEKFGKAKKLRSFNDGMWEIQNEPSIVTTSQNVVNDVSKK